METETNTQTAAVEQATFSNQLQPSGTSTGAVSANTEIAKLHQRSRLYQALWIAAAIILVFLFALAGFLIWRNRSQVSQLTNVADQYEPTKLNLNSQQLQNGLQGVLAVNGDITATGTVTADNLQGNGSGITNIQANNISGTIQPSQLDPFIAYTNKNFQVFFGTNQIFRNATNSTGAFQVQNSSASPILSVNTSSGFVGVNTSVPSIAGLSLEVNGAAKIDNYLLVGVQSTPNASILDTGPLFSNDDIQRIFAVQQISTNNPNPNSIFVGTANELLANPQYDPVILGSFLGFTTVAGGNKNIYAGGYSAMQTDKSSSKDFYLNGGSMNSVTHSGSGTVFMQAAQLNTVANLGGGDIAYAFGSATIPITYNGPGTPVNNMQFYSGNTIVDPQDASLSFLGFPTIYQAGSIGRQVGIDIQYQQSGSIGSANLVSEGYASKNYFEGKVSIGTCAEALTPSSALGNLACLIGPPGGNKLSVNARFPSSASVHVNTAVATDKALVVKGVAAQTGNLTEWQNSAGVALSNVSANGSFNIGAGAPTNRLSVVDTSDDTPANFTGTSGTCTVDTLGGGWSCVSDESLKTNILSIDGGLDKIMELRGVTYNWKNDEGQKAVAGFIAQEVEKVLPGLVSQLPDGTKTLNKDGMLPYLVSAIQGQQKQIDLLKNPATGVSVDVLKILADAHAVEFGGDITVGGNVIIKGHLSGNVDTRGSLTVAAGQTAASHNFGSAYTTVPTVVVSAGNTFAPRYKVLTSKTGFTIQLEAPAEELVNFSYQVQQ